MITRNLRRAALCSGVLAVLVPTLAAAQVVAAGSRTATSAANSPPGIAGRVGTLVVAHGGDAQWNAGVIDAATKARTGGPVEVSFLMGAGAATARFQDAVRKLTDRGVTQIVVVPMLVSSFSGHYDQIRYLAGDSVNLDSNMLHHLHMAGIARATSSIPLHVTKAMDHALPIAKVLAERALALTKGSASKQAVLIVGHGPNSAEDYAAWMANLRIVADSVKSYGKFRDLRVELVRDDAPAAVRAEAVLRVRELIDMQQIMTGRDVVVVPVLVSIGSVSRDKLPADIKGTPSIYAGLPLLPHPMMSEWIEMRVREGAALPGTIVP